MINVLLFGTGDCYQKYKKWFRNFNIVALLDNNPEKQGNYLDGVRILSPADGIKEKFEYIYILSVHEQQIRNQLHELGVADKYIFHYFDLRKEIFSEKLKMDLCFYGSDRQLAQYNSTIPKKVLFLSYDLNFSGAFLAFYHAAKLLKQNGYYIYFASMNDGPMRQMLLDEDIPVVVDVNLQVEIFRETEWINAYKVVFCNTLNFYQLLSEREEATRYIWWLHEPLIFYEGINENILKRLSLTNLDIYAAGPAAAEAFRSFVPDADIKLLLYGLPDRCNPSVPKSEDIDEKGKIRFALAGNIQTYKAQDLLIEAVKLLAKSDRERAEFYFYGNDKSAYAAELVKEAESCPEIHFEGFLEQEALHDRLEKTDVLVCPSRQDTMPTIVAEAMMHGIPCIVSDAVGTALYIRDGENGFVFPSGNTAELSRILKKCIIEDIDLKKIGAASRRVYEEYFSMNIFEKNLVNIFKNRGEC